MSRFLFSLHSWMGLIAGLGLLVIGLTGSVIVFKDEIDTAINPQHVLQPDPTKPPLPLDTLIPTMQQNMPGHVLRSFGPSTLPGRNINAYVTPAGTDEFKMYYVDPASGKPTSKAPLQTEDSLTAWMVSLHYTFFADHVGEFLAGTFGLMLFLLGLSGFWLYRSFWRTFFLLRWGRTIRIFFSDLHKMIGISSMLFNLILGFTGSWWNLSHIIGHWIEDEHAPAEMPHLSAPAFNQNLSFDALVAKTKQELPGFNLTWTSLPDTPEGEIVFFGSQEDQSFLRSPYGNGAAFDAQTGDLIRIDNIRKASAWTQFVDSFRPLHFGNFGGLPIKILWSLGGLTPAILAISGSIMWLKRRKPKKKEKAKAKSKPLVKVAGATS